ncbi:MAG: hypothetical protein JW749_04450 [Sedimentisphaerales bacterium]|nr:hypothetical protein [Sedimentisphaerales bacterium]
MKQDRRKFVNELGGFRRAVLACLFISAILAHTGCHPGMLAVLGTPTSAEMKTGAEFDLTAEKDKKILILVDQPTLFNTGLNMRYILTDATGKLLQERLKIEPEQIIDYDALADFRANTDDFSLLSPEKVGASLGADLVLLIIITDFSVSDVGQTGYPGGTLTAQAQLISVATGQRLWPAVEQARIVRVGFESEKRGADAATVRLAVNTAHCIIRYLYNCPKNQFQNSDEIKDIGWESK